jgi:hypothetical protein
VNRVRKGQKEMLGIIGFMNGLAGRALRAVLGLALIALGLASIGGTTGLVVALVGLLPIALGFAGRCLLEALAPRAAARAV